MPRSEFKLCFDRAFAQRPWTFSFPHLLSTGVINWAPNRGNIPWLNHLKSHTLTDTEKPTCDQYKHHWLDMITPSALPWGGPFWSGWTLRGSGPYRISAVEDFRGGWGEGGDARQGCWVRRGDRSSLGLRGGGSTCASRGWSLRWCGFRGRGLPPAFQGVEGDPAGLRFRLSTGGALLLLWGAGGRGVFAKTGLGCGSQGWVLWLGPWRWSPSHFLALFLSATVWGKDLQDGGLLQRSAQLPWREGQEGAVAVCGGHSEIGTITWPAERKKMLVCGSLNETHN